MIRYVEWDRVSDTGKVRSAKRESQSDTSMANHENMECICCPREDFDYKERNKRN